MPRKTKHRRHKQRELLFEQPALSDGQLVMQIVDVRGQNLYDLQDEHGKVKVFELPKRLRHVVFVRPGSFVFARPDPTRREGTVLGDIEVVILDCHLAALRRINFWPDAFKLPTAATPAVTVTDAQSNPSFDGDRVNPLTSMRSSVQSKASLTRTVDVADNGNESVDMDDMLAMGGNPNRASWTYFQPSSSEEEDQR